MGDMSDNGWAKLPASDEEDNVSVNSSEEQGLSTKEKSVDNLALFAETALRTPKTEEVDFDNLATLPLDTNDQKLLEIKSTGARESESDEDSDNHKKPAARPKLEHQSDDTENEEDRKPAAPPTHCPSILASYDTDSDDERKRPARLTMNHPLNDTIDAELFDRDSPSAKRLRHNSQGIQPRTPSRTPSHGSLAVTHEHEYDMTLQMNPLSPSEYAYHGGYAYQHPVGHYGCYETPYSGQYVSESHPPYSTHPYYQQQHHQQAHAQAAYMMQQPTSQMPQMPYAQAVASHPPKYDHIQHSGHLHHYEHDQQSVERETTATSSGEHSAQFNRGPSLEELENARTARARGALQTWYQRLEDLYRYRMENGDCNVPQKYAANEKLGIWVNKQRMEKKAYDERTKSSMTQRKIDSLNSIGFTWAKRKGDVSWNEKFRELQEYRRVHGNCEVPTKYPANPALGRWVSTQRSNYKDFQNGDRAGRMTTEKKGMLESIGFKWKMMNNGN